MRKIYALLGVALGLMSCKDMAVSNEANTPVERKAADAMYDDGDYTFYFKNGTNIQGDCDGYSVNANGHVQIYEYFQSEINKWEKRLNFAGIKNTVHRTSKLSRYCHIVFNVKELWGSEPTNYNSGSKVLIYKDKNKEILGASSCYMVPFEQNRAIVTLHERRDGNKEPVTVEAARKLANMGIAVIEMHDATKDEFAWLKFDTDGVLFISHY